MDTRSTPRTPLERMPEHPRISVSNGVVLAVAAVTAATAARWLIAPFVESHLAFITYFLAVLIVAWKTRLGLSVFALLAGAVVGKFFFVEPKYTWFFEMPDVRVMIDFWRYLITGSCAIALGEAMRRARQRAEDNMTLAQDRARRLEAEVRATRVIQDELEKAREQLEERVRQRTVELDQLNESLRRSNRELEQFASVASHDLQEPLRKVQAFGARLQEKYGGALGEQGNEYLDRVLASAGRMRKLIDDLLAFSRVATKGQPFLQLDLAEMAREAVIDLEARVELSAGRVEVDAMPVIEGDAMQIRQLFQNLIANGLKFSRPGIPPVIRIAARLTERMQANGSTDGSEVPVQYCEITVTDNGIGFEQQYADRIFQVFQRLHGRNEYEGTGIGLAICRRIAERHGGHIEAISAPDQGATFRVSLPTQQAVQEYPA